MALPVVHGKSSDVTQVALVGCGGRGTGAASNALLCPRKWTNQTGAMADVFKKSWTAVIRTGQKHKEKVDVPKERQFIGLIAIKKQWMFFLQEM